MRRAAVIGVSVAMMLPAASLQFEVGTVRPNKPNHTAGVRGSCHGIDSKYTPAEAHRRRRWGAASSPTED